MQASQSTAAAEETFHTQRTLCRRVGCDETEISRAISSGKLKFRERNGRRFYLSADLDAMAADRRRRIAARASRLNPDERRKLIAELAGESAFLQFRKETTHRDFMEAEKRIESAVYDTQIEDLERSIDRIAAKVTAVVGLARGISTNSRLQLRAERIDTAGGIIRGATVAQAGVQALGKFHVAPDGMRYPVFTDDKTLDTLMAAAARGMVKTREDHVDEVGARAGYTDNFKRVGDRVVADVHLFTSYGNRAIVLETASRAPEQIGLSIDFLPEFEVIGGKAFMRVVSLEAVDIVDAGAITHNGLL